jgi:hypothetical protein
VDVDVDVDGYGRHRDVDVDVDVDHHGYPVARRAARRAVIAIGARVTTLPPGCAMIKTGNLIYFNCTEVYYRAYYEGTTVVYVVIEAP